FVVLQSEYNLFQRQVEQEVLPYCQAAGVGFVPYAPLAGGFLTGKYRRGAPPPAGSRGESSPNVQRYMTTPYYDAIEALTAWSATNSSIMSTASCGVAPKRTASAHTASQGTARRAADSTAPSASDAASMERLSLARSRTTMIHTVAVPGP